MIIEDDPQNSGQRKDLWDTVAKAVRAYRKVNVDGNYKNGDLRKIIEGDIGKLDELKLYFVQHAMGYRIQGLTGEIKAVKNHFAPLLSK